MTQGGMYEVLKHIGEYLESMNCIYVTHKALMKITGLSSNSVSGNLKRLVAIGFLEREEFFKKGEKGRFTRYKVKRGVKDFIKDNLY